jgi:hypothetical protein
MWPNAIHEPLHLLALKMQGLSGTISYNWSFPAHPYITKIGQVQSIAGGMLYLLMPSLVSCGLIGILWMTRKKAGLLTHIVLPIYLAFDLIVNIVKNSNPQSDYYFLSALPMPFFVISIMIGIISVLSMSILYNGVKQNFTGEAND